MIKKVLKRIKQGEGLKIEFKESKNKSNKDVYATVCAFLNRNGGDIFRIFYVCFFISFSFPISYIMAS